MDLSSIIQSIAPLLGVAGTGYGMYQNYGNQQAQKNAYNQNYNLANQYNQNLGNYYSQYGQIANQANQAQQDYLANLMGMINAPVDPSQYYKQLTNAEFAAMRRGTKADLAARGIQPGGYWDSTMAETDARLSGQRYQQAIADALSARGQGLSAFAGGGYYHPTYPVQPIQPAYTQYPSYGNAPVSALGQYLQWAQKQNTKEEPRTSSSGSDSNTWAPSSDDQFGYQRPSNDYQYVSPDTG